MQTSGGRAIAQRSRSRGQERGLNGRAPGTGEIVVRSKAALWSLTIALTAALVLGLGEAIARMAHARAFSISAAQYIGWAMPDPVLGWRNNPGVHPADEGAHEPMTILADGSRATGTPAGAGTTVLIVGCSFAEGYGVRDDETFAWKLQQRFPQLRIRDFGVPGYGTYQSLVLLREAMAQGIQPALVIYGFLPFHADRNVLTSSMHQTELRVRLANREKQRAEATSLLLAQMNQLVEGAHGRLLVATLWDGGPDPETYRRVTADMRRAGIAQLNVTYAGAETRPEKILVGGTGHPGAIIHSWWADKLGQWMVEQGIAK